MKATEQNVAVVHVEPGIRSDARLFQEDVDGDDVPEGELIRGGEHLGGSGGIDDLRKQSERNRGDEVRRFHSLLSVVGRNGYGGYAISFAVDLFNAIPETNLIP